MKFWMFKALSADAAELLIYGTIGDTEWDDVDAKSFFRELKSLGDVREITVRINSPGGDVFTAQAIYNQLKTHPAKVTVYIDGLAASAASLIAMAGDWVVMPANALMMIHNPQTLAWGDANDLQKGIEVLEKVKETMLEVYQAKTGLDKETLLELIDDETWLTAEEAVEWGFADEVAEAMQMVASLDGKKLAIETATGRSEISFRGEVPGEVAQVLKHQQVKHKQKGGSEKMEIQNIHDLEAAYADLVKEIRAAALEEGAKRERERIKAIAELAIPGVEDIIERAQFEEPMTPEAVAMEIVKAQKAKAQAFLEDVKADAKDLEKVKASAPDVDAEEQEKQRILAAMVRGFQRKN